MANRQTWIVQHVSGDGSLWVRDAASQRKQQRTGHLPAGYLAEHAHLAYAATAYGVQGMTAPASHTVLSDALDAAGVYVGLTRGQEENRQHVVAADLGDAREQFQAALERDRADRGLREATERAQAAVAGIVADGPVRVVNAERARLTERIVRAEREAAKWERAVAALDGQAQQQRAAADTQQTILAGAEADAERVRAEAVGPPTEQATADGTAYLDARARMRDAAAARRAARGLRKRSASRALTTASDEYRGIETGGRRRWGRLPETPESVEPWAASVAQQEADSDSRVTETRERADDARQEQQRLTARQAQERGNLRRRLLGDRAPSRPGAEAARWRERAEAARRDLTAIEALPPVEAAALIQARAEQEQAQRGAAERALAARGARAAQLHDFTRRPGEAGPTPPDRGLSR